MQPLPLHVAERLGYIRFLHQEGIRQADRPYPLSSAAVLSFHDALELFYVLALDYKQVPVSAKTPFDSYWPELAKKTPNLGGRRTSDLMNRIRVNLKHHGLIPSPQQISDARTDIQAFLAGNTPAVFGVDYDTVSTADLIPDPSVRSKVRAAEDAESAGDRIEAMGLIAEAFDELFNPQETGIQAPALAFGPTMTSFQIGRQSETASVLTQLRSKGVYVDIRKLAQKIDMTAQIAQAVQAVLRVTSVGIEYPAYLKFRQLMPTVVRTAEGDVHRFNPPGYAPTAEHFQFCVQFIVSAALGAAEVHAYLEPPSWLQR